MRLFLRKVTARGVEVGVVGRGLHVEDSTYKGPEVTQSECLVHAKMGRKPVQPIELEGANGEVWNPRAFRNRETISTWLCSRENELRYLI